MKTLMHNYTLNLFKENRRVFMSPGSPGKAPKPQGIENAESAEQALESAMTPDEAKEAGRTARDRISRLADKVKGNKELHKKLVDLDKRLDKTMGDVDAKEQEQAKAIGKTILELNKLIDTKLPDVRKQILDSSVQVLGKGKYHGQQFLNSMVSAFSMMKVKDEYKKGDVTLKREGSKLFLNGIQYDFSSENIAGKITWRVKQKDTAISGIYDPIDVSGKTVKRVATETLKSKMEDATPAPKPKPEAAPKKVAGTKTEKGKETKEGPTKQLLAETFRTISNPDVHGQELTAAQLSALKSFTSSVGKGEVRHFKHGNTETYVARSKDGAVWQISTIVKDSHGDTASGTKYYAPRVTSSISHKLPKQYEGKVQFAETPGFTIKADTRVASKPKRAVDTSEPTPDPKILKILTDPARKAEQAKYLEDGMKEWIAGAKKAVAAVVKSLQWFSKAKALAKDIQTAKGCKFKEASDLAVKFKSRCEGCDRDMTLKKMSPGDVIKRLQSAISVLPAQVRAQYAEKFEIKAGETRLASLKKGIPASAIAKGETITKPQKATEEPVVEGFRGLAQSLKINNIMQWTGSGKSVAELKLIFGLKEGKSPVIKDAEGNEFYIVLKGKELQWYAKGKGETKFKYLGKEVNGKFGHPVVDVGEAPKKTVSKPASSPDTVSRKPGGRTVALKFHREGSKHYDNGDYAKAIKSFKEAEFHYPEAVGLQYNLATCYKEMGNKKEATKYYKEFIKRAKASGKDKYKKAIAEAEGFIKESETKVASKPASSKEGREAYDERMEKNVKLLVSELSQLKIRGKGLDVSLKSGKTLTIYRASKDQFYSLNDKGKKETFSLSDLSEVRNIAQLLPGKPKLTQTALTPREKMDIKGSVGELKKMLDGKKIQDVMKAGKQDLQDYLKHISGVHMRKSTDGKYDIATGYSMTVSKNGIIKLKHDGEGTLTYRNKTEKA